MDAKMDAKIHARNISMDLELNQLMQDMMKNEDDYIASEIESKYYYYEYLIVTRCKSKESLKIKKDTADFQQYFDYNILLTPYNGNKTNGFDIIDIINEMIIDDYIDITHHVLDLDKWRNLYAKEK